MHAAGIRFVGATVGKSCRDLGTCSSKGFYIVVPLETLICVSVVRSTVVLAGYCISPAVSLQAELQRRCFHKLALVIYHGRGHARDLFVGRVLG